MASLKQQEFKIKLELNTIAFNQQLSAAERRVEIGKKKAELIKNKQAQALELETKRKEEAAARATKARQREQDKQTALVKKGEKERQDEVDKALREEERKRKAAYRSMINQYKRFNQKLNRIASMGVGAIKTGAIGVGFAGAAGLTNVIKTGATFEKKMSEIGAVTQATDADMEAMEKTARKLGATTAFTATEAAEGMIELARAGLSTDEIIKTIPNTLNLAGATNYSLARSTRVVVASMKQFGIQAADSGRVVDVLAEATRKSLLDMPSLAEAMKYAGTVGAGFKMSLEQTVAGVAAFRNMGLEGSLAGTNFRMAMASAAKQTKAKTKALKKLDIAFSEINPEQNNFLQILRKIGQANAGVTEGQVIFGQRAGANVITLARNVKILDDLNAEIKTLQDTTAESSLTDEQKKERIKELNKELKDAKAGMTDLEEIEKMLTEASEDGGAALQMYTDSLDNVAGQGRIAFSAFQELNKTIFDMFKVPLKEFLRDLATELFALKVEVDNVAGGVEELAEEAFQSLLSMLSENTVAIAEGLVGAFKTFLKISDDLIDSFSENSEKIIELITKISEFIVWLGRTVFAMAEVVVESEYLIKLFALMFGVTKLVTFATWIGNITTAFKAASVAATTFHVKMGAIGLAILAAATAYKAYAERAEVAADRELHLWRMRNEEDYRKKFFKDHQGELAQALFSDPDATGRGEDDTAFSGIVDRGGDGGLMVRVGATAVDPRWAAKELLKELGESKALQTPHGKVDIQGIISEQISSTIMTAMTDFDSIMTAARGGAGLRNLGNELQKEVLREAYTKAKADLEFMYGAADRGPGSEFNKALSELNRAFGLFTTSDDFDLKISEGFQKSIVTLLEEQRKGGGVFQNMSGAGKSWMKLVQIAAGQQRESLKSTREAEAAAAEAEEALREAEDAANDTGGGGGGGIGGPGVKEDKDRERAVKKVVALWERVNKLQETRINRRGAEEAKAELALAEQKLEQMSIFSEEYANQIELIKELTREIELSQSGVDDKIEKFKREAEEISKFLEGVKGWGEPAAEVLASIQPDELKMEDAASLAEAAGLDPSDNLLIEMLQKYIDLVNKYPQIMEEAKAAADAKAEKKAGKIEDKRTGAVEKSLERRIDKANDLLLSEVEKIKLEIGAWEISDDFKAATDEQRQLMKDYYDELLKEAKEADERKEEEEEEADKENVAMFDMFAHAKKSLKVIFVDWFKEKVQKLWENLPEEVQKKLNIAFKKLGTAMAAFRFFVKDLPSAVMGMFGISGGWKGLIQASMQGGGADTVIAASNELIEGINRLPDDFAAIVQTMVNQLGTLINGFLSTLPRIIESLSERIPQLIFTIMEAIPSFIDAISAFIPGLVASIPELVAGVLNRLPDIITSLLDAVVVSIQSITSILPELVEGIIAALPEIISALLTAIPDIVGAIIEVIPQLIAAIIRAIPEILRMLVMLVPEIILMIVRLIPEIIMGFINGIPAMVDAFVDGIKNKLFNKDFWRGIGENLKLMWQGFIEDFKASFRPRGKGSDGEVLHSGTPMIPRTGYALLEKGEAVVPASENPWNPANKGKSKGVGGSSDISLTVNADGQLLDSILVKAGRQGRAPELFKTMRKGSGVTLGFDRGNFAPKSR